MIIDEKEEKKKEEEETNHFLSFEKFEFNFEVIYLIYHHLNLSPSRCKNSFRTKRFPPFN